MVNCSYCNKQVERNVFCSPSHKVMYHRGTVLTNGKQELTNSKQLLTNGKQDNTELTKGKHQANTNNPNWCDTHNLSMSYCLRGGMVEQ